MKSGNEICLPSLPAVALVPLPYLLGDRLLRYHLNVPSKMDVISVARTFRNSRLVFRWHCRIEVP